MILLRIIPVNLLTDWGRTGCNIDVSGTYTVYVIKVAANFTDHQGPNKYSCRCGDKVIGTVMPVISISTVIWPVIIVSTIRKRVTITKTNITPTITGRVTIVDTYVYTITIMLTVIISILVSRTRVTVFGCACISLPVFMIKSVTRNTKGQ